MCFGSAQRLLGVSVLASYLISVIILPGLSVLCFGADGHVAIEPAGKPCITADNGDTSNRVPGRFAAGLERASCLDIPVVVEICSTASQRANDLPGAAAKAPVVAVLLVDADVSRPAARPLAPAPAFSSASSRATLRTVILLV